MRGFFAQFKPFFAVLQQIGRSLMLPVSVLPVAGILLGIGSAKFSWMPPLMAKVMAQSGGSIFGNLPLIFAIGVALGFAANDGVAAVAAVVGYFVMISTMGVMGEFRGLKLTELTGVQTLETGVFGGILVGLMAGLLFRRFYRIELPPYLGFFAGKRFVPIITGVCAVILGVLMSILWPPVQTVITLFSEYVAKGNPALSVTVYGVVERGLIPFGLHHIWNNPFFFQVGSYLDPATGKEVHGDITRFFAGDKTAGILGGAYLFKMWGLPAAAVAIWHSARPERRKEVGGIMISAAFTSFLTGITEPIEFSFLFVAPLLYGLHACLAGSAFLVMYVLGGKLGYTFSHGLIDYVLFYALDTKPWLVMILGPLYALTYYAVFRAAIGMFNLKTPGREDDMAENTLVVSAGGLAQAVLDALGGGPNLLALDACITRLRVTVKAMDKVNSETLKQLGAAGVMVVGDSLQAIFGTRSENIKTDIEALLAGKGKAVARQAEPGINPVEPRLLDEAPCEPYPAELRARIVEAIGGMDNLLEVRRVAVTRVRLKLRQSERLQRDALQNLGVRGVQVLGDGVVHLIVGEESARWSKSLEAK
jgi:PTS system glucose-specific IIC component